MNDQSSEHQREIRAVDSGKVASAEIINAKAHAQVLELRKDACHLLGIAHSDGFSNFQLQAPGFNPDSSRADLTSATILLCAN
jgi:hypothetical protein